VKALRIGRLPNSERNSMANFIKVADENKSVGFINLDLVTKVECVVSRIAASRGVDVASLIGDGEPTIVSNPERTTALIKLLTASGHGTVQFQSLDEAEKWAKDWLNINIPFNQL
jgi:hypothetical protein